MSYLPQGNNRGRYVYCGLDTNKSNYTPFVGNIYKATDTFIEYGCFTDGTWTAISLPFTEEYSNHSGTEDNMVQIATSGNGTALTNSLLHRMDLSTGVGAEGYSVYKGTQRIQTQTKPVFANFKIPYIVNGVGGNRISYIGLFDSDVEMNATGFYFLQDSSNNWTATHGIGTSILDSDSISSISSGTLSILLNKPTATYYVDGEVVSTQTWSYNFDAIYNLRPQVVIRSTNALTTTAREMSICYLSWKVLS